MRKLVLALGIFLLAALAACNGSGSGPNNPAETGPGGATPVATPTPGPTRNLFNASNLTGDDLERGGGISSVRTRDPIVAPATVELIFSANTWAPGARIEPLEGVPIRGPSWTTDT